MFQSFKQLPHLLPLAEGIVPSWAIFLAAAIVGGWMVLRIMGNEAQEIRARLMAEHNEQLQRDLMALRRRGRL